MTLLSWLDPKQKSLPCSREAFLGQVGYENYVSRLAFGSVELSSSFFYCYLSYRNYRYERTVFAALAELHGAINHGEQRVVLADTHVLAGVVLGTALTHDDVASNDVLTAEDLHAQALRMRVAAVVGATYAFLVCHCI